MKILIASPRFPYEKGKADSMTVFHLVQFLSNRGHEVLLATFLEEGEVSETEIEKTKKYCSAIEIVALNSLDKFTSIGKGVAGKKPFQVLYYLNGKMRKAIDRLNTKYEPDIAYAHLIRMSEYLIDLKKIPKILAMQIAQTLNYKRLIQFERNLTTRLFYRNEYLRVKNYEPYVMNLFDRVLLISPHDIKAIINDDKHPKEHVFFNPHGINVKYYSENLQLERAKNVLMMNGDFGVRTNIDAIVYFTTKIYPLIKKEVTNVKLWIVGRNPAREVKELEKDESILVTGRVDDIRPYLQQATVGIDPIRIAAGLQNKILVSLASSLPVVSTRVGNEGIGTPENEVILLADDEEEFAQKTVKLLKDNALRKKMGRNALAFMQKYWTWEYHFERFEEMIIKLVEDYPAVKAVKNYYPLVEEKIKLK
ncbi:MAG: glycosyltransferase [Bacteroidota bacterium]